MPSAAQVSLVLNSAHLKWAWWLKIGGRGRKIFRMRFAHTLSSTPYINSWIHHCNSYFGDGDGPYILSNIVVNGAIIWCPALKIIFMVTLMNVHLDMMQEWYVRVCLLFLLKFNHLLGNKLLLVFMAMFIKHVKNWLNALIILFVVSLMQISNNIINNCCILAIYVTVVFEVVSRK